MLLAAGIVKRYPGVTALDGVDFSVSSGEVVGLVGENGAGKSTLIKVFGGLTQPDSGTVSVDGVTVRIDSSATARRLGVGVIHQELSDLDNLDVAGNVMLGREPARFGLVDRAALRRSAVSALARLGMEHLVDAPQSSLSIGQRQLVEIAKALSLEARVLIMDEPTSSLTAGETDRLLRVVHDLRGQGVGVVYVSHRLQEVKELADRVVVLRDGRNAGSLAKQEITPEAMVRLMIGRDVAPAQARPSTGGAAVLTVRGLRTTRFPEQPVTFDARAGEVVGLAGLVGAGRTELVQAVCGIDDRAGGEVFLDQTPVPPSVRGAIALGLYLAPEDRRRTGLVTSASVRENTTLPNLKHYARNGLVDRSAECGVTERMREELGIKAPTVEADVSGLSGGNQQKVVLAKWLAMSPRCLVFDEPTRGIDVGARAEIYARMRALADQGVAILMVSSDMEEVLAMSDRVLVMHEGRMAGELTREEASEEAIMALAVGNV
ncbi:MAG: sugar ABC transporter ATP-binding protein [Fimbriimonadaceae bacterium]|nr:sugar ABC transporter ATP-binding protein [Fimbriimonadaceae bacterium]